jgi:glycerophosphoryl diester phosphodiesterase
MLLWLSLVGLLASCAPPSQEGETATVPAAAEIPTKDLAANEVSPATGTLPAGFDLAGHRGARGLKPENTLPAFETALDLGVTTLELDLHLSADHVVVIWHDDKIEAAKCWLDPDVGADVPDPDSLVDWGQALMISQLSLTEIASFRCDRNPDPARFPVQDNAPTPLAGDDYRIPSLAALFEFVAAYSQSDMKSERQRTNARQVQFNIETKRKPASPKTINDGFDGQNPGPFELEILRLVEQYGLQERVIIQSFDHRSLWAIRTINSGIRLAALTSGGNPDLTGYAEQNANIWSPNYIDLTAALISKAQKLGLQVIPWTVNDAADMREMIEMGVDGMITDRPDVLLSLEP